MTDPGTTDADVATPESPEPDPNVGADAAALARAESEAAIEAAIDATPSNEDYSVAFSPRNVAVGLAIVAGLVAFAVSRRRRKRPGGDG